MSIIASLQSASLSFSAQVSNRSRVAVARPTPPSVAVPPTPAHDDVRDLVDGLNAVDPKLGKNVQALLNFIEKTDPQAAHQLKKILHQALEQRQGKDVPRGEPPAAAPGPNRAQRIDVAIQASVTELQVQTQQGVRISARMVQVTFAAQFQQTLGQSDPLVLDLDGNGAFETTTADDGHRFDLLGTGTPVQAATVTGGDAFLALDRNSNGLVDDGGELFGDQHGQADGLAELALYDDNHDGLIDLHDPIFSRLLVFQDSNRDGRTDAGELRSLADLHIARLSLAARPSTDSSNGNPITQIASFVRADGSQGIMGDLRLNYIV